MKRFLFSLLLCSLGLVSLSAQIGFPNNSPLQPTFFRGVQVFPNPADEFVNILASGPVDEIEIYDQKGNLVWSGGESEYLIDVSMWDAGEYTVVVRYLTGVRQRVPLIIID